MINFLIILAIIVSILLVLVVLAQNSKGGGLTGNMGGASQVMGQRRTTDWIEKATWVLAVILFTISLTMNTFIDRGGDMPTSVNVEKAGSSAPALPMPGSDELLPADQGSEETPAENLLETPAEDTNDN